VPGRYAALWRGVKGETQMEERCMLQGRIKEN